MTRSTIRTGAAPTGGFGRTAQERRAAMAGSTTPTGTALTGVNTSGKGELP